jgi:signal transduction histidine kinase
MSSGSEPGTTDSIQVVFVGNEERDAASIRILRDVCSQLNAADADLSWARTERAGTGVGTEVGPRDPPQIEVSTEPDLDAARNAVTLDNVDCVVTSGEHPTDTISRIAAVLDEQQPPIPLLVLTDTAETGRRALEEGASDCIMANGDGSTALLESCLGNYLDLRQRVRRERTHVEALERYRDFIHQTEALARTGGWEMDLAAGTLRWTAGTYAIHDVADNFDPTLEKALQFYHPDDRATIERAFDQCATTGEPYDLDLRIVTAEDEIRWVSTRGKAVRENGEITCVHGAIRDITAQKERMDELANYSELLENFAAHSSHELRNSLSVLEARLTLARETGKDEHFEHLDRAINRLDRLSEDIVIIATDSEITLNQGPVEIAILAEASWDAIRTPSSVLDVETDACILADSCRFRQLLENVMRNAVEHTGADTTVSIGDLGDGFYIEDDGPGIPESLKDTALEPGISGIGHGAGMGLPVVRKIAEAHEWDVTVTESADGGARFEFEGVERY